VLFLSVIYYYYFFFRNLERGRLDSVLLCLILNYIRIIKPFQLVGYHCGEEWSILLYCFDWRSM